MLSKFVFLAVLTLVCSETDDVLLAKAHNHFALKLLKQLAAENPSSNTFFSPTSVAAAFGMAFVGAKGSSEAELASVLGHTEVGLTEKSRVLAAYKNLVELMASPDVTLEVANMVLTQKSLEISDVYKQQLHDVFDAELRSADFANEGPKVSTEVNAWVRQKTRGKIDSILPEGQALDIVLFILNAVYFKGSWLKAFDPAKTSNKSFFNMGSRQVSKPAMHLLGGLPYTRLDALNAGAVEIPYSGERLSMGVLLPDSASGLPQLREGLSPAVFEVIVSQLSFRQVELYLPKFDVSVRYSLVPAMRALGLNIVFGAGANFTGISDSTKLSISDAVHKAAVEVNEEGTVATAATGVSIQPLSALVSTLPTVEFIVNRPFLYYIRQKSTNRILFIGEVHTL